MGGGASVVIPLIPHHPSAEWLILYRFWASDGRKWLDSYPPTPDLEPALFLERARLFEPALGSLNGAS